MARPERRGRRVQRNPFNGGSSLAAGALKDNSRHDSVTYATEISSSLGFSQDEKANFKKCFF